MSDKMVKVLKDFVVITNPWFYAEKKLIRKDSILCLRRILTNNGFDKYYCEDLGFEIQDLKTMIKMEFVEEILPDKKPIITPKSDSILDYEKKYNMWDATHLMKNNDVQMIDSKFGHTWKYYQTDRTIISTEYDNIEDLFTEEFGYIDSLDLTFALVKPVEEVEEKWVRIKSRTELFNKIREGKKIKEYRITDNGNIQSKIYFTNVHEIHEDVWNIFGKFDNVNYFIDYLEEN